MAFVVDEEAVMDQQDTAVAEFAPLEREVADVVLTFAQACAEWSANNDAGNL